MSQTIAVQKADTRRMDQRTRRGAGRSAPCARDRGSLDPALTEQIRRQYFCCGGIASRYRATMHEVESHLIGAGLAITPRPQRVLLHLPDVMVAIGCVRGDATAWNDLLNAHAWCLDRACSEQLGASVGLTFARRFWRDLRTSTLSTKGSEGGVAPRLQSYPGVRPIRLWLADRMLGAAASGAATTFAGAGVSLDSDARSRTLPIPASIAGRTAT